MSEISVVGGMEGVERARNVIDGRCASKDVDEGVESDKTGSDSGLDCSHHDSKTQSESETQDKLVETSDHSEGQESLPSDLHPEVEVAGSPPAEDSTDGEACMVLSPGDQHSSPAGDTLLANAPVVESHNSHSDTPAEAKATETLDTVTGSESKTEVEAPKTKLDNETNTAKAESCSESAEKDDKSDVKSETPGGSDIVRPKDLGTAGKEQPAGGSRVTAEVTCATTAVAGKAQEVVIADTAAGDAAAADAAAADASSKGNGKSPGQSVYHIKWIRFKGSTVPVVTQNENGPCPLLAIMNVLLLKGLVKFPSMIEMVTSGQLMDYLADCIFEHVPKDISDATRLNYEQNMNDAMAVFDKLQTGLDVNVRFTGVADFEYTRECIVFDLLSVPLYHGWLVDPEVPETQSAIASLSYNQLVEKIISHKHAADETLVRQALIAEEFLERSASQLTYHGLSELATTVKEDQLCVFFRNNHFSTLYKHKNELFLLVTDQGFLTESSVIWETLCNVEGDGHFVDADFRTYTKPEPVLSPIADLELGSEQQIDHDYLVALSLQEEQSQCEGSGTNWQAPSSALSDHELALQLQDEENRRAAAAAGPAQETQQQQEQAAPRQQPAASHTPKKKNNDCVIL